MKFTYFCVSGVPRGSRRGPEGLPIRLPPPPDPGFSERATVQDRCFQKGFRAVDQGKAPKAVVQGKDPKTVVQDKDPKAVVQGKDP